LLQSLILALSFSGKLIGFIDKVAYGYKICRITIFAGYFDKLRDYNSSFFKTASLGDNSIAMYLLGFIVVFIGYFLGQMPFTVLLYLKVQGQTDSQSELYERIQNFQTDMNFERYGIDSNIGFMLMLLTFIGALIALYLVVTKAHDKKFLHLVNQEARLDWSKILYCFFLWMVLTALIELTMYFFGYNDYTFQFDAKKFFPLLLISVMILPLQTTFEELFFRGYYLQGFGLLFKTKWLPILITSVCFGLVHSANPEITKYGFFSMQFYYISVGIFLGILTVMDDSLEIAIGVHAATNFYGACLVGYEGSAIQTASIYKTGTLDTTMMNLVFILLALIFYVIVSKRYKFPSLQYIFQKLDFDEHIT